MLTAAQFDELATPITALYSEYEISVLEDIARRLKNLNFASAGWQAQRLTESGMLYQDILKQVAKQTGKTEREVASVLSKAGVTAMKYDDAIYKAAGLEPIPLNLSPAMLNVLKATLNKTAGVINNLTMTTALTAQQSFIKAADLAYMQVSNGAMGYDEAIRAALKQMASEGLEVIDYASGHRDNIDVAMRRTVLTGVAQTANGLQNTRADEMGQDLVEVSAHAGARNTGTGPKNHASWQGKVYSRSGNNPKYPPFVETTGYGTGDGLGGWNCRHSFYPFFEGISERNYTNKELKKQDAKTVTYDGYEYDQYTATQYQRAIERKIRQWKRVEATLRAYGDTSSKDYIQAANKIKEWQAKMREFIAQTELDRQGVREQIIT